MYFSQSSRLLSLVSFALFFIQSTLAQQSISRSTNTCTTKYGKTSVPQVPTTTITTTYRTIHVTTTTTVYKTATAGTVTVNPPPKNPETVTVVELYTTTSVETDSTVVTDLETTTSIATSTASTTVFVTSTTISTIYFKRKRDLARRAESFPTAVTCSEHDVLYSTITRTIQGKGTVTVTPTSTGADRLMDK